MSDASTSHSTYWTCNLNVHNTCTEGSHYIKDLGTIKITYYIKFLVLIHLYQALKMWNFSNISLSILGTLDQFHVYKILGDFFLSPPFFFIFHSNFQEFSGSSFMNFKPSKANSPTAPMYFFPFYRGQRNTSWVQQIYFVMRGFITILALFITRLHLWYGTCMCLLTFKVT